MDLLHIGILYLSILSVDQLYLYQVYNSYNLFSQLGHYKLSSVWLLIGHFILYYL